MKFEWDVRKVLETFNGCQCNFPDDMNDGDLMDKV
mgnify:FL=1